MKERRKKILVVYNRRFLSSEKIYYEYYSDSLDYDISILEDSEREPEKIKQAAMYDFIFLRFGSKRNPVSDFIYTLRKMDYEGTTVGVYCTCCWKKDEVLDEGTDVAIPLLGTMAKVVCNYLR